MCIRDREGLAPGTYTAVITIRADGVPDMIRNVTFTVEAYPPSIVTPTAPQKLPVSDGKTTTMSVTATGSAPLRYRWQINRNDGRGWVDISGATDPTYTTSPVNSDNDGYQYRVYVINDSGSVLSETFTLEYTVIPTTGDNTPLAFVAALLLISCLGVVIVFGMRKRLAEQ
jgi:hypothetical protein